MSELAPGHLIAGRYRLEKQIGAGGMGSVYAADDLQTPRKVAVKILPQESNTSAELVGRFVQESKATAQVKHGSIVQVFDQGKDADGTLFMVQELMHGVLLRDHLIERRTLPLGEALDVAVPVIAGLAAAHARGIIHRDIKPENIFLCDTGGDRPLPKLFDFGISKLQDPDSNAPQLTAMGTTVGTPAYMSPEQFLGKRDIDGRADVWSMATVLYEMLTGAPPFTTQNLSELIVQIMTTKPKLVSQVVPGIPVDVAQVVAKGLAAERDQRYKDMATFVEALVSAPGAQGLFPEPPRQRYRESLTAPAAAPAAPAPAPAPAPAAKSASTAAAPAPAPAAKAGSPAKPAPAPAASGSNQKQTILLLAALIAVLVAVLVVVLMNR
jgi:serine/threonine-protein kinase